jgi:hypothetical protein
MSKKTGYCMGRRVRERPGSRILTGALVDILVLRFLEVSLGG